MMTVNYFVSHSGQARDRPAGSRRSHHHLNIAQAGQHKGRTHINPGGEGMDKAAASAMNCRIQYYKNALTTLSVYPSVYIYIS